MLPKWRKKAGLKRNCIRWVAWLTGFDEQDVQSLIEDKATFEIFFQKANLNPNAHLIKGWSYKCNAGVFSGRDVACNVLTKSQDASLTCGALPIKGVICSYRVEEIDNELTRQVRYLDKLVDELAKGKKMENILRKEKE